MTRLGKIARLPRTVREELNRRLADGEMGKRLVEWLNGLPEVRTVMAAEFGGRAINEQNLSEWKQGGFAEWDRQQEARAWARKLAEESEELEAESGAVPLADRLAAPLALALGRLLSESESLDGAEKRQALLGVARELGQLRRVSQSRERLALESERWQEEQRETRAKEREEVARKEHWDRLRKRLFPHLDEDFLPIQKHALPEDALACLVASQRLKAAQKPAPPQTG